MGESIDISVVIPAYNEETNIVDIVMAVQAVLETEGVSYEIVVIDNASVDNTVPLVKELCAKFPQVKLIVNARNFGQLRSPVHAIFQTKGRAVIGICADFQDPPELIADFIKKWRQGAKIVMAVSGSKNHGPVMRFMRAIAYYCLNKISRYNVIVNATGFGLYDRVVVDALSTWNEPEPMWRVMVTEAGFPVETIYYERPLRVKGESKNNLFTLVSFALSAFASTGQRLLHFPLFIAGILSVTTAITCFVALIYIFLGNDSIGLWIGAGVELLFCLCFMSLGIMGEHIRIISERTRSVQLVIEKERVNF